MNMGFWLVVSSILIVQLLLASACFRSPRYRIEGKALFWLLIAEVLIPSLTVGLFHFALEGLMVSGIVFCFLLVIAASVLLEVALQETIQAIRRPLQQERD
jgi:hypothetical protein